MLKSLSRVAIVAVVACAGVGIAGTANAAAPNTATPNAAAPNAVAPNAVAPHMAAPNAAAANGAVPNAAAPHQQGRTVSTVSTVSTASAGEQQKLRWCIRGNNVNLRTGPGTNYPSAGQAHHGTPVTYHSVVPGTSWYRISVGNLRNVYVWYKYLMTC